MANYVHNYVFCNTGAKEKLLTKDYKYIKEIEECFGVNNITLRDGWHLIIFDTRGMEYRTDCIKKFINEFNDTRWYCVEENEIEQGYFGWNCDEVVFQKRELSQGFEGNELRIKYHDSDLKPFLYIFINDKEIVFEKILRNIREKYTFSKDSSLEINSYLNALINKESEQFSDYDISVNNGIYTSMHLSWNGKTIYIESDDREQSDTMYGEELLGEILSFIDTILSKENIDESISVIEEIQGLIE